MQDKRRFVFVNRYGEIRAGWALLAYAAAAYFVQDYFSLPTLFPQDLWAIMARVFTVLTAIGIWLLFYGKPLSQFGFVRRHAARHSLLGLVIGTVGMSLVFGTLVLTGSIKIESINLGALSATDLLIGLGITLLVGISEEVEYRGFAMGALRSTRSRIIVLGGSAAWFSWAHLQNPGFTPAVAVGVVVGGLFLGYLFLKSGTLLIAIFFHMSWNFVQGRIFGIEMPGIFTVTTKEDVWLGSPDFGVEGGIVSIAFFVIATVLVHFFVHNKDGQGFTIEPRQAPTAAATA